MKLKAIFVLVFLFLITCGFVAMPDFDRKWEIHLIHHTHVDIGYTHTQEEVMHKQWKNLEKAMDLIESARGNPPDSRFKWNPEVTWAIEKWLEQADQSERERFVGHVRQGSIGLDALFANMLTGLCRPEELMQAFSYKKELESLTGEKIDSAMITDVPGYSWGLVTAMRENGVKYLSIGVNRGHRIGHTLSDYGDKAFYWVSPGGEDKVLCFVHGKGYSWFHTPTALIADIRLRNKFTEERIMPYLKKLEKKGYPYEILPIRYAIGSDNGPPDPAISKVVRQWNKDHPHVKVKMSTVSETFKEFEKRYGEKLPRYSGDFTPYWEDGAASTARETALARNASEKLIQAQTLWAMLKPGDYSKQRFHSAWRQVLLFNEHTWGAYNSISAPDSEFARRQWEWKKQRAFNAKYMADELLDEVLEQPEKAAGSKGDYYVDVINTHSWKVSGPVTVSGGDLPGARVETASGKVVPSQVLADGPLFFIAEDVPGFSSKKYVIKKGRALSSGGCSSTSGSISNGKYEVALDPERGHIKGIKDLTAGRQYVNQNYKDGFNRYVYVRWRHPQIGRRALLFPETSITVLDDGPLRSRVRIDREVKNCKSLTTYITMYDGLDRIDITNVLDRAPIRNQEGIHFAFPVNAENPKVRYDTAWSSVTVDKNQLQGACKNYITALRWADVSGENAGIQFVLRDAPLFEAGEITTDAVLYGWIRETEHNGVIYSYVMNNYWETNYKADQPGITTFRYSIFPHAEYDVSENNKNSLEVMQPFVIFKNSADFAVGEAPLQLSNENIIIESIKPLPSQEGLKFMVYNTSDKKQTSDISSLQACDELFVVAEGRESIPLEESVLKFNKHELKQVICK